VTKTKCIQQSFCAILGNAGEALINPAEIERQAVFGVPFTMRAVKPSFSGFGDMKQLAF
jgi:hypothetical protein